MNVIQVKNPVGIQWDGLLDVVVIILKYKKSTIDHDIYIKGFSGVIASYLTVYTDDALSTPNNETEFPKITIVFEENFGMKVQEGYVLKYLNFLIFQSSLGFSVDQTDHIMELVNELFPTGSLESFIETLGHTLHKK